MPFASSLLVYEVSFQLLLFGFIFCLEMSLWILAFGFSLEIFFFLGNSGRRQQVKQIWEKKFL